ncbi:MAG: hypothetical protein M1825_005176 [Sarcosagium campestre]|nr:MAG: hypothetical protein M1825_005176 [Sarcosagium campestre]
MTSLLGTAYESSDEDSPNAESTKPTPTSTAVVAAPDISIEDHSRQQLILTNPTDTTLTYNVPYADLSRPQQGPANPFKSGSNGNALKRKNVITGFAEEAAMSDATFTAQHRTFQSLGYTKDPTVQGAYVGDLSKAAQFNGRDVVQMRPSKDASAALRRKRARRGDPSIVDGEGAYRGPWARYHDDEEALAAEAALAGEELGSDEEYEEDSLALTAPAPAPAASSTAYREASETTTFHGTRLYDELGRNYMHVPRDQDINLHKEVGSIRNYTPHNLIHTFTPHHTKAVTALRFFPQSGHLLLSACADTKLCLWDAYHDRSLLRSFSGHSRALTDAVFSPDGRRILSASYDRTMKLWDTETGICVSRFSTGKIPHVIRFNPSPEHSSEFIAGMSDKKIIQFDTRIGPGTSKDGNDDDDDNDNDDDTTKLDGTSSTGAGGVRPARGTVTEPTQEYDHHLAAVNTLTFVDGARRFVSTSDDKSLRAWEWDIPVPIKFIAEPYMYAMNRATLHPSGKTLALQSGDNQIVVYAALDKFRQTKKVFLGHNNAGYAIDLDVSPDGAMLASGDSAGWLCIWDWSSRRMLHKIRASQSATTCLAWHPQESSRIVSAGVDGVVRYWGGKGEKAVR